jgi:putative FmdB family regulatory protein
MPIYEYRCRACGATTETLRAVADADAPVGCVCDAPDSVRLPSLIARSSGSTLPMASKTTGVPSGGAGGCCGGGCCG